MNQVDFKKKILEASVKKHQSVIDDFQQRIKDMLATDGNVNEEGYDSQVQAQKATTTEEVDLLNEQLLFARREMEELKRIQAAIGTIHRQAELGAVVETEKKTFFVSASLEQLEVDGRTIFGLSVRSPLFEAMKSMKKGDEFSFRGKTYTIINIY